MQIYIYIALYIYIHIHTDIDCGMNILQYGFLSSNCFFGTLAANRIEKPIQGLPR